MVHIQITMNRDELSMDKVNMTFIEYIRETLDALTQEEIRDVLGIEVIVLTPEDMYIQMRPEMQMVLFDDYSLACRSVFAH